MTAPAPACAPAVSRSLLTAAAAVGVATILAVGAHAGPVPLLVAVAAVQAAVGLGWVIVLAVPGRGGALLIAALAAAGGDVAVSLFPHARLAPLLPVVGLAVPAMFLHQLARRSRRTQVTASLGLISVLVCLEVACPAVLQLRAEFQHDAAGAVAVTAVALAAGSALVIAEAVDLLLPVARFDPQVSRGLPAVFAATALGAVVCYLVLGNTGRVSAGAAAVAGAVIGVVAALLAVAAAFAGVGVPADGRRTAALAALVPMSLLAPVALLVLLALRS